MASHSPGLNAIQNRSPGEVIRKAPLPSGGRTLPGFNTPKKRPGSVQVPGGFIREETLPSGRTVLFADSGMMGEWGADDPMEAQRAQEEAQAEANVGRREIRRDEAATGLAEGNLVMQGITNAAASPTRMSDWGAGVNLRQPAYEQQGQTALEAKFGREAADAQRAFAGSESAAQRAADAARAKLEKSAGLEDFNRRQAAGVADFDRRVAAAKDLGGPDNVITPQGEPDDTAAWHAKFAREKDRVGQTARASLDALRGVVSERGMLGGGQEGAGIASIIGGAQGELGEFGREEAIQGAVRAAQVADRNYAGGLTRRGQDMSRINSLLGIISSSGRVY